jgi:hypothetical protein
MVQNCQSFIFVRLVADLGYQHVVPYDAVDHPDACLDYHVSAEDAVANVAPAFYDDSAHQNGRVDFAVCYGGVLTYDARDHFGLWVD